MRLSEEQISGVFKKLLRTSKLIAPDNPSVVCYDLDLIKHNIERIQITFPQNSLNAIAVKACPLPAVLSLTNKLGAGAEVASVPEFQLALHAGIPGNRIVLDSPVKTANDIEMALNTGVLLNADSLHELKRIKSLLVNKQPTGDIGLRVNPQVGTGDIPASSTAGEYSKFGVPVKEFHDEILEVYERYPWLNAIHLHIGSQGCPLDLFIAGIEQIVKLIAEINRRISSRNRRIKVLDIGGGLPVAYCTSDNSPSMEEYYSVIHPILNTPEIQPVKLVTEFGRFIFANSGWTATRVEYVKRQRSINTALVHVGADMFIRRCYHPEFWHHDFIVTDSAGCLKSGQDANPYIIAGPLCFSGDKLAEDIILPKIDEGDFIIIRDTGAYTLSMWSRYNSRCMPKVVGYEDNGNTVTILKDREFPEDIIRFWS